MKFSLQAKGVRNMKSPFGSEDPKSIKRLYGYAAISELPILLKNYIKEESLSSDHTPENYADIIRSDPQNAHLKCPPITILTPKVTFDNRTNKLSFELPDDDTHHGIILNGNVFIGALECRDDELTQEPFVELEFIKNLSPEDAKKLTAFRQL